MNATRSNLLSTSCVIFEASGSPVDAATRHRNPRVFQTTASFFPGAKDLSMNNVYTLARAPGGQMQGAATQAM